MSSGQATQPCGTYKNWPTNPGLCGICAWAREDHAGNETPDFIPQHTGSEYRKKKGSNFTKPKKRR